MKKIIDFNEFMEIWSKNHAYHYYGNKTITQEHKKELEQKSYASDFKRYNIYVLNDGKYIILDTKTHINNTIYYNDIYDTPTITLDYFINYNMRNFNYDLTEWETETKKQCFSGRYLKGPYIASNYYDSNEVGIRFYCNNDFTDKYKIRDLTDTELTEYLKITKELKQEYITRLTKYFKKYNNNIYTSGYWADR
jgi:hypothetical protein